jgi:hypothetical protein
MKSAIRSLLAATGLGLASAVFAADQAPAPTVDVTQLPAPVQATLKQEGGRIDRVEQKTESGQTFYNATLSKAGKNYSVRVGSDGKVMEREDMPAQTQQTKQTK